MRCYAGIDIGTTNCKAIIVGEDGKIICEKSFSTPIVVRDGHRFFDLKAIEAFSDSVEEEAAKYGRLVSMGFSSVGESTVPVGADGAALDNPPLWNEVDITASEDERKIIGRYNSFFNLGISQNGLLALDKILYLKRKYPAIYWQARYFLPLTGYMAYRKTGEPVWDYSQALRSNAFSVHERRWESALLDQFGLKDFGRIMPMGSLVGYGRNGVAYGLGGHDHITGLFGVAALHKEENKPFFYESMGTSAVLAMVVPYPESDFPSLRTYDPPEGSFIPGFSADSFILTRSFRRFGLLNSLWMNLSGMGSRHEAYEKVNNEILSREYKGLAFLAECDSDFIRGNTKDGVLNYYHFDPSADAADLLQSTYLYLSVGACALEKALRSVCSLDGDYAYFAGGAVTKDPVFMRFRATALGHPICCLGTSEISALGAVFVGIAAAGDTDASCALTREMNSGLRIVEPDSSLEPRIADAKEKYAEFGEKLKRGERI